MDAYRTHVQYHTAILAFNYSQFYVTLKSQAYKSATGKYLGGGGILPCPLPPFGSEIKYFFIYFFIFYSNVRGHSDDKLIHTAIGAIDVSGMGGDAESLAPSPPIKMPLIVKM